MIERHSKVFVPVDKADNLFVGYNGVVTDQLHIITNVEEKENVYVLTEQELNQVIIEKLKSLELVSIAEDGSFIYSPIK